MSYKTKSLITDINSKPVPQYYNTETDEFEVTRGANGANRVILYGANGETLLTGYNPGVIKVASSNNTIVPDTVITWDGVKVFDVVPVPVTTSNALYIKINNDDQSQGLTVTFELEVSPGLWIPLYDVSGYGITFPIDADSHRVYGAFPPFSRYLQARLKFTAAVAPTNTKKTIVQVQEVA